MMGRTRELAALLAVSTGLGLAACTPGEVTAPSGATSGAQSGVPNLDTDRIDSVLDAIQTTLAEGDKALDASKLEARVADPALRMRAAQYALAKARNDEAPPLALTAQSLTVTNAEAWPRAILDIGTSSAGMLPDVFLLVQRDARSDYMLTNWTRLLGGTSLTTMSVKEGSPYLAGDAPGFVMTPSEAVSGYVDMLNDGDAGNDQFTSDEFADTYASELKSLSDSIKAAGKVTAKAAPTDLPPEGVVLQDGSALVAGSFTYTHTYARTVARSTLKLGGDAARITEGGDKVVGTVTIQYLVTVLVQIPKAGSGDKVSVVGAERAIESSTRDNSKKPEGE